MPSVVCALFFFALFLPSVNVPPVPSFLPSLCPLLKTFIFFLSVPSLYLPLPSLNPLCDLCLFALFLPSSNALSVPSFLPSLCPLLKSFKFSFFVPSFISNLPVLFERFIFHNLCPYSDQPHWQLYLNAHFAFFALFVPSCLLLMCILDEFFPPDLKLHSSQSYPKTSCCKLVWFFRIN